MHPCTWASAAALCVWSVACSANTDPIDGPDESFLSGIGNKADDGLPVREVLCLVNRVSESELDGPIGLDRRAARAIVHYRSGADGQLGTADDVEFGTLEELDAIPYVGPQTFARLVDYVEQFPCGDGGQEERAADGALCAANSLDELTLDADPPDGVGLDARAAQNIYEQRIGPDGLADTDDDILFLTRDALDEVSWVGPSAIEKLQSYADEHGCVPPAGPEIIECNSNADCGERQRCLHEPSSTCGTLGRCIDIPIVSGCALQDQPVCGCDGNTYRNPCTATHRAGVLIAYSSACTAQGCRSNRDCESDEYCVFPEDLSCFEYRTSSQAGSCRPRPTIGCPRIALPVCGCDFRQYSNSCEAERAGTLILREGGCYL